MLNVTMFYSLYTSKTKCPDFKLDRVTSLGSQEHKTSVMTFQFPIQVKYNNDVVNATQHLSTHGIHSAHSDQLESRRCFRSIV